MTKRTTETQKTLKDVKESLMDENSYGRRSCHVESIEKDPITHCSARAFLIHRIPRTKAYEIYNSDTRETERFTATKHADFWNRVREILNTIN